MAFDSNRYGLGVNWLQQLARADDDQRRASPVQKPDLPPMFRPGCGVHKTMKLTVDVGSLTVGQRFWKDGFQYEVMRNNGARYVQATGIKRNANMYLEQDEEVEVDVDSD